jgi:cell division protein FtsQ
VPGTAVRSARKRAGKRSSRVVVPLKQSSSSRALAALPSGKTIALLFAALVVSAGLYLLARESSLFAVRRVEIEGAPPALSRQLQAAMSQFRGKSLVTLDRAAVERAALSIPAVKSVSIDRDFPNSLRVFVKREQPIAVLRRGQEAWLIAASGKVVRPFPLGRSLGLPRIWAVKTVTVSEGEPVSDREVQAALNALAPLARVGRGLRVTNVVANEHELTLTTRSRIELRFGDASQAALKLMLAAKILPTLAPSSGGVTYLDISVPSRPVSGTSLKSQVKG